jgi:hypothetical protein
MRQVNWESVEESTDGGRVGLEPGGYVVRILTIEDNEAREYVHLTWDIAEGEHAGHYSDDWGKEHPFAHDLYLSYKDTALGMLKGRLSAITKSNPGFDAEAAWNGGQLTMFIGKLFGVNLREEEFNGNMRLKVGQVVDADAVRNGLVKPMKPKYESGGGAAPAPAPKPTTAAVAPSAAPVPPVPGNESIPF